ncbi:carbohydrate-binding domain-containing protein [candidate division KSB1 bacterium]|nr:MAG: carbohydrate-binding domain-containing protein [candidate division KSB1 bacterium]
MRKSEKIFLLICACLSPIFTACERTFDPISVDDEQVVDDQKDPVGEESPAVYSQSLVEAMAANSWHHEESGDYSWDHSQVVQIALNGNSITVSGDITINDGAIHLVATDDGFNATKGQRTERNDGSHLTIHGGYVAVNCSRGDGLDSNGNTTVTAGTVVVHGPTSQPEVGFDVNGTFKIAGGLFIATGPNAGHMIETPSATSTQNSVIIFIPATLSASSLLHIEDASGDDVVTFKPVRNVYYIVLSSPRLMSGVTYSVHTGGSATGTNTDGLYSDGAFSGGTLKKNFTITGKVTQVSI